MVQRKTRSHLARRKNSRSPASREKSPVKTLQGAVNGGGEVVLYEAPDGGVQLDVRLERETVWLTQAQMADLFGRERSVITKHLRNVYNEHELDSAATCAKFAQVQIEGPRTVVRDVDHYNLDVIISVGYRVKSTHGTRFRIWATRTLKDHLLRGYTLHEKWLRWRCSSPRANRYRRI